MINKSKKIDKFGMLLLVSTIVTFNLIIGGNEKTLPVLVIGILTGLLLIIILIKKFKYKEKLIKSKIDIVITIFMFTLTFPLIFKTYCTYQGTIEFIMKYFFVYTIYILARNIINSRKRVNILIVTTIISSLIIIILGLDILNNNYFKEIIGTLNLRYTKGYRFSSTFGYANAASIYMVFCVFLAINRIENSKKIIVKVLYCLYIVLATYIIYISYSRLILIMYILVLSIYFFAKLVKKLDKKKLKILGISFSIFVMLIITYLSIAMKYSCPKEINKTWKIKRNIEANKEYEITFNIDIIEEENSTTQSELQIIENNKYFTETELVREALNPKLHNYNIKIKTSEDYYYLELKVLKNENKKIIINNCYINGEEYIFSYKYLPTIIARLINTFSLEDNSIVLRKQFYENCLRISEDNLIVGHGGNAWKKLSQVYQDYPYAVKETHSYFFELLISYGIVGTIVYITAIIMLFKTIIKKIKNNIIYRIHNLSAFIGLMILIIYGLTFDMIMSFIVIILIVFLYSAIFQYEEKIDNKNLENIVKNEHKSILQIVSNKYVDYLSIILIIIVFELAFRTNIAKYFIQDAEIQTIIAPYISEYKVKNINDNKKNNLEEIKTFMLNEPYSSQNYITEIYWNKIFEQSKKLSEKELLEYIDFGIDRLKKIKFASPMYFSFVLERVQIMADIVNDFKSVDNENVKFRMEEIKQIMIDEYEKNEKNIIDIKRNHKSKEKIEQILNKYKDILKSVNIEIN